MGTLGNKNPNKL